MRVTKLADQKLSRNEQLFHTKISYTLPIIAIVVMVIISIRRWFDDPLWSQWSLLQAILGFIGLISLQMLGKRPFIQREFRPVEFNTASRTVIIFFVVTMIMTATQGLMTISGIEMALYFVFASVCEEIFFRGLLLYFVLKAELTIKLFAVLLQALAFMVMHVNYWGDLTMMISVMLSGIAFGLAFVMWKDLTANILAHFIWNVINVGITFSSW